MKTFLSWLSGLSVIRFAPSIGGAHVPTPRRGKAAEKHSSSSWGNWNFILGMILAVVQPALGLKVEAGSIDTNEMVILSTNGVLRTASNDVVQITSPINAIATQQITSNLAAGAFTRAVGLDGVAGDDQLFSQTSIVARAETVLNIPLKFGKGIAAAESVGMTGGSGRDAITNSSWLNSTARGDATIGEFLMQIDVGVTGWPTTGNSLAVGLDGGTENDVLVNNGTITVLADSFGRVNKGRVAAVEIPVDVLGLGDASTTADASAVGIMAGPVQSTLLDTIINHGLLSVSATATSTTRQLIVELLGAARVDDSTTARSLAIGVQGGGTNDNVQNGGTINVHAASDTELRSAELKMKGLMMRGVFDLLGFDVGKFSTLATSEAIGLRGEGGNDSLFNWGSDAVIDARAEAAARSTAITVAISPPLGFGPLMAGIEQDVTNLLSGGVYGDAATKSLAQSMATSGGTGDDFMVNEGHQSAVAKAGANSAGINADVSLSASSYVPFPGAALVNMTTRAEASSVAFDAGSGNDLLLNSGLLESTAFSQSDALSIGATLKGTYEGLGIGVTVVDSASEARSVAAGLRGGFGSDSITNLGTVHVSSGTKADALSVGASVGGSEVGMQFGVALADASTSSRAYAYGIDAGDSSETNGTAADTVLNAGNLHVAAGATNSTITVGVTFSAALKGVGGGVAATRTDGTAEAVATGIQTGLGKDVVLGAGGSLVADSTAQSFSDGVTVAVSGAWQGAGLGAALSKTTTSADAAANGISSGADEDLILNATTITNRANALSDSSLVTVGVSAAWEGAAFAVSLADSKTEAAARSAGIDGGAGSDTILNAARIASSALADSIGRSIVVNVAVAPKGVSAGLSFARTGSEAIATATGITGGDGDDAVTQMGAIDASATARSAVKSISLNFSTVGAAIADVTSISSSSATGLDGGTGSDSLNNEGAVNVSATSRVDGTNTTANFVGYASGDVSMTNTASAIGIQGGAISPGAITGDAITNRTGGAVTVNARAETASKNHVIQAGGAVFADTRATAAAFGAGLVGGTLADAIVNDGQVVVSASADIHAGNMSFQLSGVQAGAAGVNAFSHAVGIAGSGGTNFVANAAHGTISTYARAETAATEVSANLLGAQILLTGSDARALSQGVATGAEEDRIENLGHISSTAGAEGNAGAGSIGLFALTLASSLSEATVEGINSGQGADRIANWGAISVGEVTTGDEALAKSSTTAISLDFLALAMTSLGATANATGINGAGGDDLLVNAGLINVGQSTQWMAWGTSFGFGGQLAGAATTYAAGTATGNAAGISGGDGSDIIVNATNGSIVVHARSYSDVDTENYEFFSTLFPSSADSTARSFATGAGIQGGNGDDYVYNAGIIEANAYALADAQAVTTLDIDIATWTFGETEATATATATGVDLGTGHDVLENEGTVSAFAKARVRSSAHSDATFEAATVDASGRPVAVVYGLKGGTNGSTVFNSLAGTILAHAVAVTTNDAGEVEVVANGDDGRDAYANAGTVALPVTAQSGGVALSGGNNTLTNEGTITAISETAAWGHANTHVWYRYPTSDSEAYGNASAHGIMAGDGANSIVNGGSITVSAVADAVSTARAFSRDYGPTARAAGAANASAYGIRVGDGDNTIINDGQIWVSAKSTMFAQAYAEENAPRTEAAYAFADANAHAFGIFTGNGHNLVVNRGSIIATAEAGATALALTEDDDIESAAATAYAESKGIQTGSGNDRIINQGSILTTNLPNSRGHHGIAIDAGAGNDTVSFLDGALARGDVVLGSGNDAWELSGHSVLDGLADGGTDTDTLLLRGDGGFHGTMAGFERLVKTGPGTFTVDHLSTMDRMELWEGTLRINDHYQFAPNSVLTVNVGRDGSYGELEVMGTADLNGTLIVQRGRGAYTNGTKFGILQGENITNRFASEVLPASTRLLSFQLNYLGSAVEVEALASSFTTVADNRLERTIGRYLDRVLPLANGDFSDVLGEFQMLSEPDFNAAFASFSPAVYDANTVATLANDREIMRVVQQHLRDGRASQAFRVTQPRNSQQLMRTNEPPAEPDHGTQRSSESSVEPEIWAGGFGHWNELEGSKGFPGFDYSFAGTSLGIDLQLTRQLLMGIVGNYSSTRADVEGGHGEVESYGATVYATHRFARSYLEGALSCDQHLYENQRRIRVGSIARQAESDHSGQSVSFLAGAGTTFTANRIECQPFASLLYTRLNEESFRESGADSLNMRVESRDTDSLKSELGLRIARPIEVKKWMLIPAIGIAWEHDFHVDDRVITASFSGAPGTSLSVPGSDLESETANVHSGITLISRRGFSTSLNYDGQFDRSRVTHGISGLVRLSF